VWGRDGVWCGAGWEGATCTVGCSTGCSAAFADFAAGCSAGCSIGRFPALRAGAGLATTLARLAAGLAAGLAAARGAAAFLFVGSFSKPAGERTWGAPSAPAHGGRGASPSASGCTSCAAGCAAAIRSPNERSASPFSLRRAPGGAPQPSVPATAQLHPAAAAPLPR